MVWQKLAIFKQTEFKKIVVVDIDMQFLRSGMELAEMPGLSVRNPSLLQRCRMTHARLPRVHVDRA